MQRHIAGHKNVAAHSLSRNNIHKFFYIYQHKQANPIPTPLLQDQLQLLLNQQADWPSHSWSRMLNATLRRLRALHHPIVTNQLRTASASSAWRFVCPFPLSETILCSFATYLAKEGLKYQSIKCYMYISALRHAQITNWLPHALD